jgi:hypothetical protein
LIIIIFNPLFSFFFSFSVFFSSSGEDDPRIDINFSAGALPVLVPVWAPDVLLSG